jgi:Zn-dependent protease
MKCQICGIDVAMPYSCPHCGGQFCSQHRLPENHACPQISRARTQRQNTVEEVLTQTGSNGYNYSFNFNPQPTRTRQRSSVSSFKELKHLGIAALLVIGIGFSIGVYENMNYGRTIWTIGMMSVFAVCLMSSFLIHELAHKFTAQKRGMWAEFRLTLWGAIFTFASVFLPMKMIAPGAMMIQGTTDRKSILKISIAGPITNIIFALTFFALIFVLPTVVIQYKLVFIFIGYINAFMAVFNLIPFGIFDGYKIFSVNKKVWALAFIPSLILLLCSGYMLLNYDRILF